ncbi:MAG: TetR/AcrR family transcriptional regulator [Magnetococcales bacterium]|nr:TetR/AcrR family transcriptional regulator [Magnetococcales bacterium]
MGRTSDARERLIQSGMELLHSGGYARAGVREICARAGVQKGSFYHFFATKGDLGLAVLERYHSHAHAVLDQALTPELSPAARIERLFQLSSEIQQQFRQEVGVMPGCPFGNLVLEMSTCDEGFRLFLARVLREIMERLEGAIRTAEPESDGQQTKHRAEAIFALLEGAILIAKAENDPSIIQRMGIMAKRLVSTRDA